MNLCPCGRYRQRDLISILNVLNNFHVWYLTNDSKRVHLVENQILHYWYNYARVKSILKQTVNNLPYTTKPRVVWPATLSNDFSIFPAVCVVLEARTYFAYRYFVCENKEQFIKWVEAALFVLSECYVHTNSCIARILCSLVWSADNSFPGRLPWI